MCDVMWVLEAFDRKTELIAARFELPETVTDEAIGAALGESEHLRNGMWPATAEMLDIARRLPGIEIDEVGNEYFVEYQQDLAP